MTYQNVLSTKEVHVSFEYPLQKNQVVDSFSAKIGDREVVAVIKNKKRAKKEYLKAKAQGKKTIYA